MAGQSTLIPRGLDRQLELALKSLSARLDALKTATGSGGVTQNQLFALQQQIAAIQIQITDILAQIDALEAAAAPSMARHLLLMGG